MNSTRLYTIFETFTAGGLPSKVNYKPYSSKVLMIKNRYVTSTVKELFINHLLEYILCLFLCIILYILDLSMRTLFGTHQVLNKPDVQSGITCTVLLAEKCGFLSLSCSVIINERHATH